jgi:hypothetical protein
MYLPIVPEIMDIIDLQAHLLQGEVNEHLKQTITEQQKKIKSLQDANIQFNAVIITNRKSMVPKDYKDHYKLMLYFDSPFALKLLRISKGRWTRSFERIKK